MWKHPHLGFHFKKKQILGQQDGSAGIKETVTKSNALRLVPKTHVVEGEGRLPQVVL